MSEGWAQCADESSTVASMETLPVDRAANAEGPGHGPSDGVAARGASEDAHEERSSRMMGLADVGDDDNDNGDDDEGDREPDEDYVEDGGEVGPYGPADAGKQGKINLKEAELSIGNYSMVAYETVCRTGRTIHACIIPAKHPTRYTFKAFEVNGVIKTVQFERPKPAHYIFRARLIEVKKAKGVSFEKAWNDALKIAHLNIRVKIVQVKEDQEGGFSELEFKMSGPGPTRAAGASCEPAPAREAPAQAPASASRGPEVSAPTLPAVETGVTPAAETGVGNTAVSLFEKATQGLKEAYAEAYACVHQLEKENVKLRAMCNELGKRKAEEAIERLTQGRDKYKNDLRESEAGRIADKATIAEQARELSKLAQQLNEQNRTLDNYYDRYGPLCNR